MRLRGLVHPPVAGRCGEPGGRSRADRRLPGALVALGVVLSLRLAILPSAAWAQATPETAPVADAAAPAAATAGAGWTAIFGQRYSRPHVTVAVWALHPFEAQFPELDWTWGYGVKADQWLVATFVNSYDRRGVIAALERYWWVGTYRPVELGIGYRAGVVTGYDEELLSLAGKTPLLPFTGLLLWADLGPFSLDVFYAYRGITLESGLTFR